MCCERKVSRCDGEVGIRWDVLLSGRVGFVGGPVRRDTRKGVCYAHGVSGRVVWKEIGVKPT